MKNLMIKPGLSWGLLPLHQFETLPHQVAGSWSFFFLASISALRRIYVKLKTSSFFSNSYFLKTKNFISKNFSYFYTCERFFCSLVNFPVNSCRWIERYSLHRSRCALIFSHL
jgi:hypothetical protein